MKNNKQYFSPSTNLKADVSNKSLLENIIITKQIVNLLKLFSDSENSKSEAVSIVGPYGSGKSTTALFLYHYLRRSLSKKNKLELTKHKINPVKHIYKENEIMVVVGSKISLELSLKKELKAKTKLVSFIKTEFVDKNKNLILIIDEFGKYLEYSSDDPKNGDVYALQELAELATRSDGLFKIITIRHQAIMGYFSGIKDSFLNEWKKIQGRFHDVVHSNTIEDTFDLIAPYIEKLNAGNNKTIKLDAALFDNASLGDISDNETFKNSYPLHPFSTLLLISAYKRFAQNERSVFTFLNSNERYSLNYQFNLNPNSFYTLSDFYDYIFHNLSHYLIESAFYQDWDKIEVALRDLKKTKNLILVKESDKTEKLIKIIGLLDLFGNDVGLRANIKTLSFSIYNSTTKPYVLKVKELIQALTQDNIITKNLFQGQSFHLWHGAHTNINELIQATVEAQKDSIDISRQLEKTTPNDPYIAKKHLVEKGTCRTVELRYQSIEDLNNRSETTHDGVILIFISVNTYQRNKISKRILQHEFKQNEKPLLIQIPSKVENQIRQYIAINFIEQNNEALKSDKIGRLELTKLKNQLSDNIEGLIRNHFVLETKLFWKYENKFESVSYRSILTNLTSAWFESLYPHSPEIKNELVNVTKPSPSAMTGVKKLLIEMLKHSHLKDFGIKTSGPEKSVYINLLEKTGIHKKVDNKYKLTTPDEPGLILLWNVWTRMIEETKDENERITINDLITEAVKAPYGLKFGLAHILAIVKVFSDLDTISLYHKRHMEQEFMYLAKIEIDTIQLLVKRPENFEIKYVDSRIHQSLFAELYYFLNQEQKDITTLLDVARSIIAKISMLRERTIKTRKGLSSKAQTFIEEVRDARSPEDLIYTKIPLSLGLESITSSYTSHSEYVDKLELILKEIEDFEANIFPTIKEQLIGVWELGVRSDCTISESKVALNKKINTAVTSWVFDEKLKEFIKRSVDKKRSGGAWLESISSHLVGKLPERWVDDDTPVFIDQLRLMKIQYEEAENIYNLNSGIKIKNDNSIDLIEEKIKMLLKKEGISEKQGKIALLRLLNKYVDKKEKN